MPGESRRTVAEVLTRRQERKRRVAEQKARERARRERDAAVAYEKRLDAMALRENAAWQRQGRALRAGRPRSCRGGGAPAMTRRTSSTRPSRTCRVADPPRTGVAGRVDGCHDDLALAAVLDRDATRMEPAGAGGSELRGELGLSGGGAGGTAWRLCFPWRRWEARACWSWVARSRTICCHAGAGC
jgi:hypothetical protein